VIGYVITFLIYFTMCYICSTTMVICMFFLKLRVEVSMG